MKKKLSIILIIIILVFSLSKSCFAVNEIIDTTVNQDVYFYCQNDIDIARKWMSANFTDLADFKSYIANTYNISMSNRNYFALVSTYNNSATNSIRLALLSSSNYDHISTGFNYYGIDTFGFVTTGTVANLIFSNSSSDDKQILSFTTASTNYTFFAGYYYMKLDLLFTDSNVTNNINDTLTNVESNLNNTQAFLTDSNVVDDGAISDYSNSITNEVTPYIDHYNQSEFSLFINKFFNLLKITPDDPQFVSGDVYEDLDFQFTAFGHTYYVSIPHTLTEDFILNICGGDVSTQRTIISIIQYVYILLFFIFFTKNFIDIFYNILSLNFQPRTIGNIINLL